MSIQNLKNLHIRLRSLAVFRELLADPVLEALADYLGCVDTDDAASAVSRYAEFISRLFAAGSTSLASYIQSIVGDNENSYICAVGRGDAPDVALEACVWQELDTLQTVAELTPEALREGLSWDGWLPGFRAETADISGNYRSRCANIGKFGYGIYAKHRMFYINSQNHIVPVRNPDKTRLSSLVDYKREQQIILDNTVALLAGKPAANIRLTGDAGTGKSSTVKAIVNELHDRGLRILEVRK